MHLKLRCNQSYQIKALNNFMNHTEVSEILNEIQSSFDISKMGYLDQNLWPPIRNRIASKLVKKNITKKGDNNLFVDFCNSFIFCFFNKPKIKDVIIISDGLYSVKVKNATHDRVMYGVIKNNTELGHSIEKIFLDKLTDSKFINYSSAFIFKTRIYASIVAYCRYLFLLSSFFSSKSSTLYYQINNIINFCKLKNIDLNTRDIFISALSVYYHGRFLKKYFKKFSSLNIYQSNSFDPIGLSINYAANSLGFETNTVQHGGQSKVNPYFLYWNIDKENSKLFFSNYFLCWTDESFASIKLWNIKNFIPSKKLLGYSWLNAINNEEIKTTHKDKLMNLSRGSFNIIYTLQPSYKIKEDLILELVKISPHIKIWIRKHPSNQRPLFSDQIKSEPNIIETNISNKVLLTELFSIANLHITSSSSSVYEAEACGIETIFIDINGKNYFPEMIKKGSAKYIIPETSFFNYILDKIKNI